MTAWASRFTLVSICAVGLMASAPSWAETLNLNSEVSFNIPPQSLEAALLQLSKQGAFQLVVSAGALPTRVAPRVSGRMSIKAAVELLLKGTDLAYKVVGERTLTVVPRSSGAGAAIPQLSPRSVEEGSLGTPMRVAQENAFAQGVSSPNSVSLNLEEIVVTGSRIKGAQSTAPVIRLSQQDMREAGQSNLGEVIRSLPLNFNGSQNPGVRPGAIGSANQNINGGSAINLRGLGADATLTLFNGRRLSYDSFIQSVDISAIPLGAVDSIQIVADGASAIYGSDAVAGVANVITKRDYNGLSTTGRWASTTGGGDFQQEYDVVGGKRWSAGGFILAYDFERATPIQASQRSYLSYIPSGDIYPYLRHHSALLSGHQDLGERLSVSLDTFYTKRWMESHFQTNVSALQIASTSADSVAISPTLTARLSSEWTLALNAVYARDRTDQEVVALSLVGGPARRQGGCYCNSTRTAEADLEGRLLELPGGSARLALGAGYRSNEFMRTSLTSLVQTEGQRSSRYGFAEVYAPVIGPEQQVPVVYRLALTGAIRYERYSDFGSITTPKFGFVLGLNEDIDVKGAWGRSFKAPTLSQEYSSTQVSLNPAALFGGQGLPATATAILLLGGNRNLAAEQAETWTATLSLHPHVLQGLSADLSYFNIKYQDRVIAPVRNLGAALSDSAYRQYVQYDPTAAEQQSAIEVSPDGLANFTGRPFVPANVAAIIWDSDTNVARQDIRGVDLNARYEFPYVCGGLNLSAQASWLESQQRDSALSPLNSLAGTVFNPPHLRARTGATWHRQELTLSSFFNYVGPVSDNRTLPAVSGGSMITLDLTALYRIRQDVDLALTINNLTNQSPPYLRNTSNVIVSYDSTNYSALGRLVSFSASKRW